LNIEDKNGWTPLHHAVRNNALKSIEFLLDSGVDDTRATKQQEAPVHLAIIHNQPQALEVRFDTSLNLVIIFVSVKFLLSKRPDQVNLGGERGKTPLHYAATTDNIDAAKILVCNFCILFMSINQNEF
jgi:ankyrin repeat protein